MPKNVLNLSIFNISDRIIVSSQFNFEREKDYAASRNVTGTLVDLGSQKVHLWLKGKGKTSVVLDHSLGGVEAYFLIDEIAKLTRVCIYDRAGYGWDESSFESLYTKEIVAELDLLLTKAEIEPPYLID